MDKSSSGSKGSADSAKRRREAASGDASANAEDDFTKSTGRSKKRTVKRQTKRTEIYDSEEEDYYHGCLDEELDFDNLENEALNKTPCTNAGGRVLPQWTGSWNCYVIGLLVDPPSSNYSFGNEV